MKLTIEITLDNAAFHPDPSPETSRILRALADDIDRKGIHSRKATLTDINGNRVGHSNLEEDDEPETPVCCPHE